MLRTELRGTWPERVRILEDIAHGRLTRRTVTRKGDVVEEPSFRDRVAAIGLLDQYAGVETWLGEPTGPQFHSQEEALEHLRDQLPGLLRRLYPGYELRPVDPTDPPAGDTV